VGSEFPGKLGISFWTIWHFILDNGARAQHSGALPLFTSSSSSSRSNSLSCSQSCATLMCSGSSSAPCRRARWWRCNAALGGRGTRDASAASTSMAASGRCAPDLCAGRDWAGAISTGRSALRHQASFDAQSAPARRCGRFPQLPLRNCDVRVVGAEENPN